MGKNIVLCSDGTNNQFNGEHTNVIRTYRSLRLDAGQIAFYDPGVGTMPEMWKRTKLGKWLSVVDGLAVGAGFQDNVADAYRYLMQVYEGREVSYSFPNEPEIYVESFDVVDTPLEPVVYVMAAQIPGAVVGEGEESIGPLRLRKSYELYDLETIQRTASTSDDRALTSGIDVGTLTAGPEKPGSATPGLIPNQSRASRFDGSGSDGSSKETTATISGRVVGEDGTPVSRAGIIYKRVGSADNGTMYHAAEDGTFSTNVYPPGRYVLRVYHEDYVVTTASVTAPVEGLLVQMPSDGSVIEGRVVDDAGIPVARARIKVLHIETGELGATLQTSYSNGAPPVFTPNMPVAQSYPHREVISDDAGFFRWDKLPAGLFDVNAKSGTIAYTRLTARERKPIFVNFTEEAMLKTYIALGTRETTSGIVLAPHHAPTRPDFESGVPIGISK